jgi:hypothetical protein
MGEAIRVVADHSAGMGDDNTDLQNVLLVIQSDADLRGKVSRLQSFQELDDLAREKGLSFSADALQQAWNTLSEADLEQVVGGTWFPPGTPVHTNRQVVANGCL